MLWRWKQLLHDAIMLMIQPVNSLAQQFFGAGKNRQEKRRQLTFSEHWEVRQENTTRSTFRGSHSTRDKSDWGLTLPAFWDPSFVGSCRGVELKRYGHNCYPGAWHKCSAKLQPWIKYQGMFSPGQSPSLEPSHNEIVKPLKLPLVTWWEWRHASPPAEVPGGKRHHIKAVIAKGVAYSLLLPSVSLWTPAAASQAGGRRTGSKHRVMSNRKIKLEHFQLHNTVFAKSMYCQMKYFLVSGGDTFNTSLFCS